MRIRQLLLFGLAALSLTSCFKDEALNAARYEFMRYGLNNIPDEYLMNYATEMLKKQDRVEGLINSLLQKKLCAALKNVVTMEHKQISVEDFTELVKE